MEWLAAILAACLVGAFVHDDGRKRQKKLDEIDHKLDLLLKKSASTAVDESSA